MRSVPGGKYRLTDGACEASLRRVDIDGTVHDISGLIQSLDGKVVPPTNNQSGWRFRLNLGFSSADGDGQTAFPPQPCRGSTQLAIGDDVGEAQTAHCQWDGTQ